jgi:hypothetical protein
MLLSIGEGKAPVVHDGNIILLDDEITCKIHSKFLMKYTTI